MNDTALIQPDKGQNATDLHLVNDAGFADWAKGLNDGQRAMLEAQNFTGKGYETAIVPATPGEGNAWFAVGGVADPDWLSSWCLARLAEVLPAGTYRLKGREPGPALHGWQTAQYKNLAFRSDAEAPGARVLLTQNAKAIEPAIAEAQAVNLVRRLVDTPPEVMGPAGIEAEFEALVKDHDARLEVTRGDQLEQNYPLVHAVGRAAARHHAPRIMHLTWGKKDAPVLAIVGKGVTFDSGGLSLKTSEGMKTMKCDMAGAATMLGAMTAIARLEVPVNVIGLAGLVENMPDADAFKLGDVLTARNGTTIEVLNTDAEGRLVLADVLAYAVDLGAERLIDLATLTGACVVALGEEITGTFSNCEDWSQEVAAAAQQAGELAWPMPMHDLFGDLIKSDVADIKNVGPRWGGAVTAAKFLERFVDSTPWVHLDIAGPSFASSNKPHREGGGTGCMVRTLVAAAESLV